MTEAMTVAVIAGAFSIVTALIAAFAARSARRSRQRAESRKAELIRTHADVAAFHRLEELYTEALADEKRNAEGWKRKIREDLRDMGHPTPSRSATAHQSEQRIARLT